jgi:hypothetical protein
MLSNNIDSPLLDLPFSSNLDITSSHHACVANIEAICSGAQFIAWFAICLKPCNHVSNHAMNCAIYEIGQIKE